MNASSTRRRSPSLALLASLITDRWHWSSRFVVMLAVLVLGFCNVPGQEAVRVENLLGNSFEEAFYLEHGWPLTYLTRSDHGLHPGFDTLTGLRFEPRTLQDCFLLWKKVDTFHPWWLAADLAIVLLISLMLGVGFELWRRQRSRLWHLHLRDILVATVVIALIAGWYVQQRRQHARVAAVTYSYADIIIPEDLWHVTGVPVMTYRTGGPTWLRMWAGDSYFRFLDRPFSVEIDASSDWSKLEALPSVHVVNAHLAGTNEELNQLKKLPNLEALSLDDMQENFRDEEDALTLTMPKLPTLLGLDLNQPYVTYRHLDNLTSLQYMRATHSVDNEMIRELAQIHSLREVALQNLNASHDLSPLSRLPNLVGLDLFDSDLTVPVLKDVGRCKHLEVLQMSVCNGDVEGLVHIMGLTKLKILKLADTEDANDEYLKDLGNLKQLQELDLSGTQVGGNMSYLAALQDLEILNLSGTPITDADLKPLVKLPKLRSLDIGYTNIGEQGIAYIQQMKSLTYLRIQCSAAAEKELQQALPDCSIQNY